MAGFACRAQVCTEVEGGITDAAASAQ